MSNMTPKALATADVVNYQFISLAEAQVPAREGLFRRYENRWWSVHPDKGLAFWNPVGRDGKRRRPGLGAPQCNSSEVIARMVAERCGAPFDVILVESAWVPVDASELRER